MDVLRREDKPCAAWGGGGNRKERPRKGQSEVRARIVVLIAIVQSTLFLAHWFLYGTWTFLWWGKVPGRVVQLFYTAPVESLCSVGTSRFPIPHCRPAARVQRVPVRAASFYVWEACVFWRVRRGWAEANRSLRGRAGGPTRGLRIPSSSLCSSWPLGLEPPSSDSQVRPTVKTPPFKSEGRLLGERQYRPTPG